MHHSLSYDWKLHCKPFGLGGIVKQGEEMGHLLSYSPYEWKTTVFVEQPLAFLGLLTTPSVGWMQCGLLYSNKRTSLGTTLELLIYLNLNCLNVLFNLYEIRWGWVFQLTSHIFRSALPCTSLSLRIRAQSTAVLCVNSVVQLCHNWCSVVGRVLLTALSYGNFGCLLSCFLKIFWQ